MASKTYIRNEEIIRTVSEEVNRQILIDKLDYLYKETKCHGNLYLNLEEIDSYKQKINEGLTKLEMKKLEDAINFNAMAVIANFYAMSVGQSNHTCEHKVDPWR